MSGPFLDESSFKDVGLVTLADGAAVELFEDGLRKALDNIDDPNTEADVPREIILKVRLTPGSERDVGSIDVKVETKLAPIKGVRSTALFKHDGKKLRALEHNTRQGALFQDKPANVSHLEQKR